jgi:uncharacterized sulfatase
MYDLGHDAQKYPLEKILAMADAASMMKPEALAQLGRGLQDGDSAVRYWAAMGLLMRGQAAVEKLRAELRAALNDEAPAVRTPAARALGLYGNDEDLKLSLAVLRELISPEQNGLYISLEALNAVDALGKKAASVADAIRAMPQQGSFANPRTREYVPKLVEHIFGEWGVPVPNGK